MLTGVPYKVTQIDKYPGAAGKRIQGGLLLYLLDTTYFKDKISRSIHADEPGCKWHLHRNPSADYLQWFCGEHKVLKREKKRGMAYEVWQPVTSHAKTHYWDTEVYAAAAAEMLRKHLLQEKDVPKIHQPRQDQEDIKQEKWLPRRKNWLNNG
jgi:phage terminase large subunit GpA-like protein